MRYRLFRNSIWLSVAVILLVGIPWTDFQNHPHLETVGWVPFVTPPWELGDSIANVLLYAPFGLSCSLFDRSRRNHWRTFGYATALSLGTEASQIFSHSRFASSTDVVCNMLGTIFGQWAAGVLIATGWRWREPKVQTEESDGSHTPIV